MSATARARLFAAVDATPSPTRPQGNRRAAGALVASVVVALAIFEGLGGLEHAAGRPLTITLEIAFGWAVVCAALTWLLARGGSTLGPPMVVLRVLALTAPVALLTWLTAFNGSYVEPFSRIGWRCLGGTLAMAALPLAAFLLLRRGVEPRGAGTLGATVGALCGSWASVLLDLWCPLTNTPHVLVGHVVPVVLLMVAGAVLGRWLLGPRALRLG